MRAMKVTTTERTNVLSATNLSMREDVVAEALRSLYPDGMPKGVHRAFAVTDDPGTHERPPPAGSPAPGYGPPPTDNLAADHSDEDENSVDALMAATSDEDLSRRIG